MPSHPDRVRRAGLPEGYQFGDAGTWWYVPLPAPFRFAGVVGDTFQWRPPHVNRAERLTSAAYRITQAQIAADHA